LMSKYAELLAQGWDPAAVTRPVDPELEKMRLAHEMELKRMEMEEREKEKELEAEKERKEKEAEEKQKGRELRKKKNWMPRGIKWCRLIDCQPRGWSLRKRSSKARLN